MYGVVTLRIRRSMTLEGVQSSVIGLYEALSVGGLFGLRSVMILPTFQSEGMTQNLYEKLAMLVRVAMPC